MILFILDFCQARSDLLYLIFNFFYILETGLEVNNASGEVTVDQYHRYKVSVGDKFYCELNHVKNTR